MNSFIYCPNCQTKLVTKHERLIDCKKCDFVYYLSPAMTNGAIIENNKGEILLVKRKINPKKGFWDTPGGFVEYHETLEQSIIRKKPICIFLKILITPPYVLFILEK